MVLLVDIDGVLKKGDEVFPFAGGFFQQLKQSDLKHCLLSNATNARGEDLKTVFKPHLPSDFTLNIVTALDVAMEFAKGKKVQTFLKSHASSFFNSESNPDCVIVGDIEEEWNYENLNKIFSLVRGGADLLALQMNKFGYRNGEIKMDAGAFLKAVQYASDCDIKVLGKPSLDFYNLGKKIAGYNGEEALYMIGDDLKGDIEGGKNAGCSTVLVLSGKTDKKDLETSAIQADAVFENLMEFVTKLPLNN